MQRRCRSGRSGRGRLTSGAVADDRACQLLGHVEGAAATEVEDRHAWMVIGGGHLEHHVSVEDILVEADDTVEVSGHCGHVVEPVAHRHGAGSFRTGRLPDEQGCDNAPVSRSP